MPPVEGWVILRQWCPQSQKELDEERAEYEREESARVLGKGASAVSRPSYLSWAFPCVSYAPSATTCSICSSVRSMSECLRCTWALVQLSSSSSLSPSRYSPQKTVECSLHRFSPSQQFIQ